MREINGKTPRLSTIIKKDVVLIFSNAAFRRSDDKASLGYLLLFDGSIICVGGVKAILVALNRAKVLGVKNAKLCVIRWRQSKQ